MTEAANGIAKVSEDEPTTNHAGAATPVAKIDESAIIKSRGGSTNSDLEPERRRERPASPSEGLDERVECSSPPSAAFSASRRSELSPPGAPTSTRTFNVSFSEPLEMELIEALSGFEPDQVGVLVEAESGDERSHATAHPDPETRRERCDSEIEGRSLSDLGDEDDRGRRSSIEGAPPSAFAFHRSVSARVRDRAPYRSPSFTALSTREPSLAGYSHRDFFREPSFAAFSIRDETVWRIALEVSPPFMLAGIGMVAAGVLLHLVQFWSFFIEVDQAMIMVPALLGLKGNLEMTLASRMSTQANMGKARDPAVWWRIALSNLVLTQAQALVVGFLSALVAMLLGIIKPGSAGLSTFRLDILLLLVATAICTTSLASLLLGSIISLLITFSKRYKCNPDIIALPIAASLGDLTTLGFLALIGQGLYSAQPGLFWLLPTLSAILLCMIPIWLVLAYRSEHTRQVVSTGWLPIIMAMAMSSCAGLVLEGVSDKFKNLAVFQPVVNGIAGNLAGIQASNISTRLHQLFEEPGRTTCRFAMRGKSERSSCADEPGVLPSGGSRKRKRRFGSPQNVEVDSPSSQREHVQEQEQEQQQVHEVDYDLPKETSKIVRPNCMPLVSELTHESLTVSTAPLLCNDANTPVTPQNGTTTTSIINGNGALTPTEQPIATVSSGCAWSNGDAEVRATSSDEPAVTVHISADEDDEQHSERPPSPPPSLAAISFRRQRSMSYAWSTLTSAWVDDRGLLVHGCCANPYHAFCGPRMHARTSRVLLYLAIPGHFLFMVLIYLVEYTDQSFYSILYLAAYLIAVFVQIMMLLYTTHWLVQFLWKRGNDPDNFAIPYLTATGDILGSLVLAGVFYLVFAVTSNDWIVQLKIDGNATNMANFTDFNETAVGNSSLWMLPNTMTSNTTF